jgi:hypothetical protein
VECAKRSDIITLDVNFADFFSLWNQFIVDNGGIYIAHCWENDAKMLLDTQQFLGVKGVIKKKYLHYMDSDMGTYDKNHASIVKICSERVLKERAPVFKRNFHRRVDAGGDIALTYRGYYPSNLEAYSKAQDADHEQKHNSVCDTLDLIGVMSSAISDDGIGIIGNRSYYYQSKNFDRPSSNPRA